MADDLLWDMGLRKGYRQYQAISVFLRLDFGSWKDWNVMFNDAQSWTYILLVRCIFCITVRVKIGNCQPAEPVENCPMPKLGGRIWGLRDHSSENFSAKPDLWVSAPTVPWHAAKTWEWNRKSSAGSGFFHDFSMFGLYGVRVKVYSPDLKQIAAVIQMAQVEWLKPCNLWVSVVLQGHLIGCAQVAKEFLGSIADTDFDDFVGNVDLKCEDPEIQRFKCVIPCEHHSIDSRKLSNVRHLKIMDDETDPTAVSFSRIFCCEAWILLTFDSPTKQRWTTWLQMVSRTVALVTRHFGHKNGQSLIITTSSDRFQACVVFSDTLVVLHAFAWLPSAMDIFFRLSSPFVELGKTLTKLPKIFQVLRILQKSLNLENSRLWSSFLWCRSSYNPQTLRGFLALGDAIHPGLRNASFPHCLGWIFLASQPGRQGGLQGETGDDSHAVSVCRKYHDSQQAESFVPMLFRF